MENEKRSAAEPVVVEQREGETAKIIGYAAVFNTMSEEMRMPGQAGQKFREVIRPGAFAAAIDSGEDIVARFEHGEVIGRRSNNTLRVYEDARGLRYEIEVANTTRGRDTVELVRRGDIRGSSFEMVVGGGDSWRREGQTLIREIRSVKRLLDVSPTSSPAYPATEVALRSLAAAQIEGEPSNDLSHKRLAIAERS